MGVMQCNKTRHTISFDPFFYEALRQEASSNGLRFSPFIEESLAAAHPGLMKKAKEARRRYVADSGLLKV